MQVIALANENQKDELLSGGVSDETTVVFINTADEFWNYENSDGFVDLLFDGSAERINLLNNFSHRPVIINSVVQTLQQLEVPFVRVNAWPGFLGRSTVEVCGSNAQIIAQVENIFARFNKKTCWVRDEPGFITARVIAMIINEAWFALEEKVSTKEEIDAAMKLGTNYPFGPFEWCDKIGAGNICDLLNKLMEARPSYQPASLLKKEASKWP